MVFVIAQQVNGKAAHALVSDVNLFSAHLNIKAPKVESPLRWFLCISDITLTYILRAWHIFHLQTLVCFK